MSISNWAKLVGECGRGAKATYHELILLGVVGDLGNGNGARHILLFASGTYDKLRLATTHYVDWQRVCAGARAEQGGTLHVIFYEVRT